MHSFEKTPIIVMAILLCCGSAALFSGCTVKVPSAPVESNIALNKPATASATYDAASGPEKAVDGDTATGWNSGKYPPAYLEIDLAGSFTVNSISVMLSQSPAGQTAFRAVFYNGFDSTIAAQWSGLTKYGSRLERQFGVPFTGVDRVRICSESSPSWIAFLEVVVNGVPE